MTARRGWKDAGRARPAHQCPVRFGRDLLRLESSRWPPFILVTTPSAYKTASLLLNKEPADILLTESVETVYLQRASGRLTDKARIVIGLGGGKALDGSKYIALAKDLPLILVPTITSTASIVRGVCPRWQRRRIIGQLSEWPWIDCECVLVDYDAVLAAPYYLNTSGLGDVLCCYAKAAEWRWATSSNKKFNMDEQSARAIISHCAALASAFPSTLTQDTSLTPESVRFIIAALKSRPPVGLDDLTPPTTEHAFLNALEYVNDRSWMHGEIVALGAVIIAWDCDANPEGLAHTLDKCRVRWRPQQVGIRRDELRRGLEAMPVLAGSERTQDAFLPSLVRDPIIGKKFDRLWDFLGVVPK